MGSSQSQFKAQNGNRKHNKMLNACANGNTKVVLSIVASDPASVQTTTHRNQSTPLHLACSYGQKEVVEVLLANHANIEARDVVC